MSSNYPALNFSGIFLYRKTLVDLDLLDSQIIWDIQKINDFKIRHKLYLYSRSVRGEV